MTSGQRQRTLQAVYEAGFRIFDVAPAYGNGVDELELGVALRGRREHCEINTKFGVPIPIYNVFSRSCFPVWRLVDKAFRWSAKAYSKRDFSIGELEKSLDASLKRLQTDYIDTFFLHEPLVDLSPSHMESLARCIESQISKGKIKRFGVAGPAHSISRCSDVQAISVYQTKWEEVEWLPDEGRNKGVILYGAYAAFRSQHILVDFSDFIKRKLVDHKNLKVIVSTRSESRLRALGEVIW
jgi:aryl-alcohol dehydrogenase-like predicted oxidoreductase